MVFQREKNLISDWDANSNPKFALTPGETKSCGSEFTKLYLQYCQIMHFSLVF
jgi:hypothetical protein